MKSLLLSLLCLLAVQLSAGNNDGDKSKTRTVTGRVVDPAGEVLPGAVITVKETGEQFFADLNGDFQIAVPVKGSYSVCISTIGFQSKEINGSEFYSFTEHALEPLK